MSKLVGRINMRAAVKAYPCSTVKGKGLQIRGIGDVPKIDFINSNDDQYAVTANAFGMTVGYIGTRKEIEQLVGEGVFAIAKQKTDGVPRCLICRKVIGYGRGDHSSDGKCYCDNCRDEGHRRDLAKLEAFTLSAETKGAGYYAVGVATLKQFFMDYDAQLDDYLRDPFNKETIAMLKDSEGWMRYKRTEDDGNPRLTFEQLGAGLDPQAIIEWRRREALKRYREAIAKAMKKEIKAAVNKATKPLKEEIAHLEAELEEITTRTGTSEQAEGQAL